MRACGPSVVPTRVPPVTVGVVPSPALQRPSVVLDRPVFSVSRSPSPLQSGVSIASRIRTEARMLKYVSVLTAVALVALWTGTAAAQSTQPPVQLSLGYQVL